MSTHQIDTHLHTHTYHTTVRIITQSFTLLPDALETPRRAYTKPTQPLYECIYITRTRSYLVLLNNKTCIRAHQTYETTARVH